MWDYGRTLDEKPSWHWIKLYTAAPVSIINDAEKLQNLKNARAIQTLAAATNRHAGIFEGRGKYDAILDGLVAGSTRVLECEAQVRTVGNGAIELYMYLDRDAMVRSCSVTFTLDRDMQARVVTVTHDDK